MYDRLLSPAWRSASRCCSLRHFPFVFPLPLPFFLSVLGALEPLCLVLKIRQAARPSTKAGLGRGFSLFTQRLETGYSAANIKPAKGAFPMRKVLLAAVACVCVNHAFAAETDAAPVQPKTETVAPAGAPAPVEDIGTLRLVEAVAKLDELEAAWRKSKAAKLTEKANEKPQAKNKKKSREKDGSRKQGGHTNASRGISASSRDGGYMELGGMTSSSRSSSSSIGASHREGSGRSQSFGVHTTVIPLE
jgi:hypothetical protein